MTTPRIVTVTLQLGGTEDVEVKQLTVSQFPQAFDAYEREDEQRLVEMACGRPPRWCDTVSVDSYGDLVSALYETNATGFFAYAGRRSIQRASRLAVVEQIRTASVGSISSRNSQRGPG